MADQAATGSDRQERRGAADAANQVAQRARQMRPSAVLAIVVAAGFLVWLLFIRGGDNSGQPAQSPHPSSGVVSSSELLQAVAGAGYPVYWVGQKPDIGYAVDRSQAGQTQIRYLPAGEDATTDIPYLTVASYQQPKAYKNLEKLSLRPGSLGFEVAHGGLAYFNRNDPKSVYVAFPDVPTQIEVFDPHKGLALKIVRSGAVSPIG